MTDPKSENKNPSAFYDKFERHSHGEGIKGFSTHYCGGCGHGLAHKFLAESIEELGIKNNTVAISPVGCSVFMFYYLDVGNSQAPHGRAPVVALGHKFANPGATVVSYQGDGDLASIGLAEIISTAQLGVPIAVIFVNNAIYGMTGGQMAPTSLMGQKTATSPYGRDSLTGKPFKMAEMMALLDGPIYVERVALFNAKERIKAKKAIKKAMRLQTENKGFAFVEVLAECPTHLKLDGLQAEKWLVDNMLPVFPLGVKKDLESTNPSEITPFPIVPPIFDPKQVLEVVSLGQTDISKKFASSFPFHLCKDGVSKDDVALKLAGSGGDGAQTAAMLIAAGAINEGFDSTHIPSYGPESRGGTSYADVHVSSHEVLSPAAHNPNILMAFNAPSLLKFSSTVKEGGFIFYDLGTVDDVTPIKGVKIVGVPFTKIALELGNPLVKNIVALGALQEATSIFPVETFLNVIKINLKSKPKLFEINEQAFFKGKEYVKKLMESNS